MNRKPKNLKSRCNIRRIDRFYADGTPEDQIIFQAAEIIRNGGVVVFPTTCLYGLAADAFNPEALKKIFAIKKRATNKPILILIQSSEELNRLVATIPESAAEIISKIWPGQVTLILKASASIPDVLITEKGRLGVRVPEHPTALKLAKAVSSPITGTSANLSGQQGCANIEDLHPSIVEEVDLIIDAGPLKGGLGSTVIDLTQNNPAILREGRVSRKKLMELIGGVLAKPASII